MKYSELPPEIQETVKILTLTENGQSHLDFCIAEDLNISNMFTFSQTSEGGDYWWEWVNKKSSKINLPLIFN